jgi:hypothetical protein
VVNLDSIHNFINSRVGNLEGAEMTRDCNQNALVDKFEEQGPEVRLEGRGQQQVSANEIAYRPIRLIRPI